MWGVVAWLHVTSYLLFLWTSRKFAGSIPDEVIGFFN
jgi:hypothetical protein